MVSAADVTRLSWSTAQRLKERACWSERRLSASQVLMMEASARMAALSCVMTARA